MRGGEKVLEILCEIFPQADIYTLICDRKAISKTISSHIISPSFLQRLPFSKTKRQYYLPLFPLAVEQFDLRNYDLVISSDSVCMKGVLTRSDTLHICYCHTPMRYVWDLYFDYLENSTPFWARKVVPLFTHYLRQFDYLAAQRVDYFIANSKNTAQRIKKHYGKEAEIIYPPVDIDYFTIDNNKESEDFYLYVGELVAYKRADLIIDAFNKLNKRLKVIGDGSQYQSLKKRANSSIELLGKQPKDVLRNHFQSCKAFIFAAEEDFGITPVEAQACGKPVIAYKKGGALESVIENKTGIFFEKQTVESLIQAINKFENSDSEFGPAVCRENVLGFGKDRCKEKLRGFILKKLHRWLEREAP